MTVRLVALPGRVAGQTEPAAVRWINPEHIVSIRPRMGGGEPELDLIVEIKLEGIPLFETWLGSFRTVQKADERWQAFLTGLTES